MKIILPKQPTLNEYIEAERANKFLAAKIKKVETENVYHACRKQKLSARLKKCNFNFTWFVKDKRKDPDNIFFTKCIFDGMVKAGIIYNDTQEWVGTITHKIKNDKNERVELEIV